MANGSTILQQVQAIQAMGGNITISFGGAVGQEAALTAPSAATLQAEYQSVIDRYQVNTIDSTDYAKTDSQLALLSMWSVARDNGSGAGSHAAAPDNSGVAQQPYQYAGILHQFDHQG